MKMYFGSVKFFKQLILGVVFGWIIVFTALAVFFGIKYFMLSKDVNKESNNNSISNELNIPDGMSLDQIYLMLCAKGYTPEDILEFLQNNETYAVEQYFAGKYNVTSDTASSESAITGTDTSMSYTKLYPELYADAPIEFISPEKTIYLTFDDGPSENTLEILDILDRYDIKATFFMSGGSGERTKEIMKEVAGRGHTLAVHSLSHNYNEVYESVEAFLEDFNNTYMSIYEATGVKPQLYRFPGGSINNYNRLISTQIIAEVTRRGFVYHDWNVSGEDATKNATWTSIYNNVLNGIDTNTTKRAVILLHDSADKHTTVTTVEDIIDALQADGYSFAALDNTIQPFTFSYTE